MNDWEEDESEELCVGFCLQRERKVLIQWFRIVQKSVYEE